MKRCPRCGLTKPESEFYRGTDGGRERLSSYCKGCVYESNRERRRAHPERPTYRPADLWSHRRRRYGLTREQFEQMLEDQDGLCGICKQPPDGKGSLCVDHDHRTGKVRGLLCNKCNWALGHMGDNPDLLMNAITYLEWGFVP